MPAHSPTSKDRKQRLARLKLILFLALLASIAGAALIYPMTGGVFAGSALKPFARLVLAGAGGFLAALAVIVGATIIDVVLRTKQRLGERFDPSQLEDPPQGP